MMRDFLFEMAAVAISAQVGLDLKYFGAPDSVILFGMIASGLAALTIMLKRAN